MEMTMTELKSWQEKTVVLHLFDGEVTTAKIHFVDEEYEDIIVTVLTSNRHYEQLGKAAFTIRAADIERVHCVEG